MAICPERKKQVITAVKSFRGLVCSRGREAWAEAVQLTQSVKSSKVYRADKWTKALWLVRKAKLAVVIETACYLKPSEASIAVKKECWLSKLKSGTASVLWAVRARLSVGFNENSKVKLLPFLQHYVIQFNIEMKIFGNKASATAWVFDFWTPS